MRLGGRAFKMREDLRNKFGLLDAGEDTELPTRADDRGNTRIFAIDDHDLIAGRSGDGLDIQRCAANLRSGL